MQEHNKYMGLEVVKTDDIEKINRQISALEWQIKQDTSDTDREIHTWALNQLKEHLSRLQSETTN